MSWLAMAIGGLAVLAASVAALEYGLRHWISTRAPVRICNPLENLLITPDPAVFPSLPKNSRFTTNLAGARGGDEPDSGKTFRVLAVGGSGVECLMLDDAACWTAVAAQQLSTPASLAALGVDHVRVWNNGCSGVTTDTLIYALPDEFRRYKPLDVVVVMTGASAINTWCDLDLPEQMPPQEPSWIDLAFHRNHDWGWSPRRTATAELIRRLRALRRRPPRELTNLGRSIARARQARATATRIVRDLPDASSWIAHYKRTMAQIVKIAGNHAKQVILVHQPIFGKTELTKDEEAMLWHGGLGPEGQKTGFITHDVLIEMCQLLRTATREVAQETGAKFADPTDQVAPTDTNYYDHFHFTPEGARCLGRFVAEQLIAVQARQLALGHDGVGTTGGATQTRPKEQARHA